MYVVFQALETLNNGKPFKDAYNADLPLSIKTYRYATSYGSDNVIF